MTDNEIIKALECCGDADCDNCPYSGDDLLRPCNDNLVKDTIDLINRQKAEIERLEQENFDRSLTVETWKCEAVKEFAERLKEKAEKHDCRYYMSEYSVTAVDVNDINNLVKETVGEQE